MRNPGISTTEATREEEKRSKSIQLSASCYNIFDLLVDSIPVGI